MSLPVLGSTQPHSEIASKSAVSRAGFGIYSGADRLAARRVVKHGDMYILSHPPLGVSVISAQK
jgi:hypothetical protein